MLRFAFSYVYTNFLTVRLISLHQEFCQDQQRPRLSCHYLKTSLPQLINYVVGETMSMTVKFWNISKFIYIGYSKYKLVLKSTIKDKRQLRYVKLHTAFVHVPLSYFGSMVYRYIKYNKNNIWRLQIGECTKIDMFLTFIFVILTVDQQQEIVSGKNIVIELQCIITLCQLKVDSHC